MDPSSTGSSLHRRTLLGTTVAASLAGLSGCFRQLRNNVAPDPDETLSLSIASVSADADPQATELATELETALAAAGIDVDRTTFSRQAFSREVLINHAFDLFVGRTPTVRDPEFLFETLHSRFVDEWGWQNPFGFANIMFDVHLERQRDRTGSSRRRVVEETLRSFANEQPFTPICRPVAHRLADTDSVTGWGRHPFTERYAFVDLDATSNPTTVTSVVTDPRVTRDLNPLSIAYQNWRQTIVDLLYDSLATYDGGELVPWLATDWTWTDGVGTVSLREATWHDGEPVTADDVAFTYEFLADTSMGENEVASPAPVYRGQATAIESINVLDDRRLRITPTGGTDAAENAFTIPILPAHVWRERTERSQFAWLESAEGTTEAVVTDNVPPVGSGLFEYTDRTDGSRLELARNDAHFTRITDSIPETPIAALGLTVVADSPQAVERVTDGEADLTLAPLDPTIVDDLAVSDPLTLLESPSPSTYCVGFNARSAPLTNPYFRRTVAQLLDKAALSETVFAGEAEPVAAPLGDPWLPSSLEWTDQDPVTPFLGTDGELDVSAVRRAFEDLGYRYDEEGDLLVGN